MGSIRESPTIPKQQKAILIEDPGPDTHVSINDIAVPDCQPDDVLIRLTHTGICHADVAFAFGEWKDLGYGMEGSKTPGHEGVGEVVHVGKNVKNFTVGDRVGTKWLRSVCWDCSYCKEGNEGNCLSALQYGRTSPGSFQQYVTSPANFTPRIPAAIPSEKAGPLLCAGVTMYRSLQVSRLAADQWVVILGAGGGLGHLGIQFAHKMGLKVIGIDSGDKKQFCESLGADHFVDFTKTSDVPGEVRKISREGAHAVLVATGSRRSYEQAKDMLRKGGGVVCIGLPGEPFFIPFQPIDLMAGGYWVTGSSAPGLASVQETLDFAAEHQVSPAVQVLPMAEAEKALKMVYSQQALGRIVLDLR